MSQCKPAPTPHLVNFVLMLVLPILIRLYNVAWLGHCSILLSLVRIFPMLFSKFVSLCMILESLIWLLFIAFFDIFRVLFIMVCNYISPSFLLYCHIWMLIGVDVLTPVVLPLATVYLGDNLVSLFAKRQPTVSKSSSEVEYRGVANVVFETC